MNLDMTNNNKGKSDVQNMSQHTELSSFIFHVPGEQVAVLQPQLGYADPSEMPNSPSTSDWGHLIYC